MIDRTDIEVHVVFEDKTFGDGKGTDGSEVGACTAGRSLTESEPVEGHQRSPGGVDTESPVVVVDVCGPVLRTGTLFVGDRSRCLRGRGVASEHVVGPRPVSRIEDEMAQSVVHEYGRNLLVGCGVVSGPRTVVSKSVVNVCDTPVECDRLFHFAFGEGLAAGPMNRFRNDIDRGGGNVL